MMEDSTSSNNLLSMKTYPLENNNLLESDTYKQDFDVSDKMEIDSENPQILKKKRQLRFIIAWGIVVFAVVLLIALVVLFVKFSGDDGDEGSIFGNVTSSTTISPTPTLPSSSTPRPSTSITPSYSVSTSSSTSSIITVPSSSVVPVTTSSSSVTPSVTTPSTTTTKTVITTTKPLPACLVGEFQCSDGACINNQSVCNGKPDCSLGEDETMGCECTEDQFRCHSGQCIDSKFRCDKVLHCADNSDEMNCTDCTGFQCKSGECLWSKLVQCDGHINCLDLSDEMGCNVRRRGYEQCANGMWIHSEEFCNGVDNCFDNSDEHNCDFSEFGCNSLDEIHCGPTSPDCILHQWRCDGHRDCSNGWDENNCGECGLDEFKCSNYSCIPNHQVCDGIKQCIAGTDEADCVELYKDENSISSLSGVVKLKSSSGQFVPICGDLWSADMTREICDYIGHSDDGATSSLVTLTSAPESYMQLTGTGHNLKHTESIMSRFVPRSSCSSEKVVSVNCQPSDCGKRKIQPLVPFIVGGDLAPKGQWPWVVSISMLGKGICGGAIVGPRWILTAAHCVTTLAYNYTLTPHYFEITAGTVSRTRTENDTAQRRHADKIILYPNITRLANGIYDYDIALIHLDSPLQYGDYVQPVCLPSQGEIFPDNSLCYLAGWGFINPQHVTVDYLREGKMQLFNCAADSNNNQGIPINMNSTICAGYQTGLITGCKGDSGSPLMCKDNRDHWNVVGIMSYGASGCNGDPIGSVNKMAKVSAVSDWISSVTET